MLSLLALLGILAVLILAASTTPQAGGRSMTRVALVLFGLVSLMSLTLASSQFGNRLAPVEGYWFIAGRIFLMLGLTIGMPLLLAAGAVQAASRTGMSRILTIAAGLVAAIGGWAVGMICMFAIVWS